MIEGCMPWLLLGLSSRINLKEIRSTDGRVGGFPKKWLENKIGRAPGAFIRCTAKKKGNGCTGKQSQNVDNFKIHYIYLMMVEDKLQSFSFHKKKRCPHITQFLEMVVGEVVLQASKLKHRSHPHIQ